MWITFTTALSAPSVLIMGSPACWLKRYYPHLCVCDGASRSSSEDSDVDAVNFELYHTVHPGDEIEIYYGRGGSIVKDATASNRGSPRQARPGKGKGPASAARSQLKWDRLSPAGDNSFRQDHNMKNEEVVMRSAVMMENDNNVEITELSDEGLAHASPFDAVVRGVPCCTKIPHPQVLTMEDDGLCVVKSNVRPRSTNRGAENDDVAVVMESLVARRQ